MNNIDELANNYYLVIEEYEEYLKRVGLGKDSYIEIESNDNDKIRMMKEINNLYLACYEERYLPWREIKGDIKLELTNIFKSNDIDKIMPYIGVCDGVYDDLTQFAQEDLEKYYSKIGKKVNNERMKNKIEDETWNIMDNEDIDKNKYSKNTLELFSFAKKFDKVCNDLENFYKDISNKEKSIEMEM